MSISILVMMVLYKYACQYEGFTRNREKITKYQYILYDIRWRHVGRLLYDCKHDSSSTVNGQLIFFFVHILHRQYDLLITIECVVHVLLLLCTFDFQRIFVFFQLYVMSLSITNVKQLDGILFYKDLLVELLVFYSFFENL